jgi:hypothetical protein
MQLAVLSNKKKKSVEKISLEGIVEKDLNKEYELERKTMEDRGAKQPMNLR